MHFSFVRNRHILIKVENSATGCLSVTSARAAVIDRGVQHLAGWLVEGRPQVRVRVKIMGLIIIRAD
jgi:hypothetical protein|eukprot:COSAG01_NODE_67_length_29188_cov_1135.609474_7_plen_67_part_00